MGELFRQAGFTEIECRTIPMPMSGWSIGKTRRFDMPNGTVKFVLEKLRHSGSASNVNFIDPDIREVGRLNRDNIHRMLASQAMYLFTERLGYRHTISINCN